MHTKIGLAAALLLSSSAFALAQDGPGKGDMSPGGGQKMERAPGGGDSGPNPNSARDNAPGQMKGDGPAMDAARGKTKDGRSARDDAPGQNKQNAAGKNDDAGKSGAQKSGDKADNDKAGNKERGATGASTGESGAATKPGKGSVAEVTTEQKTRARTAFEKHKVEPAKNINVNVSVGVVVPRTVHFYAVPSDIVEIVPVYRGYKYFMLDPVRIVIVDPDSYEVVDIIVIA